MKWNYDACVLIDSDDMKCLDFEKVEFYNGDFAISSEPYDTLDALAPKAVEYAIENVFGKCTKKY